MAEALRIAVANTADPDDPSAFSGSSAALLTGLRAIGVDGRGVGAELPVQAERLLLRSAVALRLRPADARDLRAAMRREHPPAALGRLVGTVRDARIATGLRRAGPLDGVVSHGTEFRLPSGTRYVTWEDATTKLARRSFDWPHNRGSRPADQRRQDARSAAAYAGAQACCAMSHWAAASLREDFGVPAHRVHVVGVGAVRRLTPPPARDWSVPRLLFVGFDWERKNGPRVLEALSRLREEHPGATLDIVGGHPRLDLPGVTGHGPIALEDPAGTRKLEGLFHRATCFVMPSRHEPAGQAYIEAGAAGIPSLGTTHGGAATCIGPGGEVVDPEDDAAILAALRRIGSGDGAAAAGERARAHAALLTWERVAERIVRAVAPPGTDTSRLAPFL